MIKEIKWTGLKGQNIKVTVELQTKKTVDLDGNKFKTGCCEKDITAKVDGKVVGSALRKLNTPVGSAIARIGQLGLTQKQYDDIKAAIKEIENTPEWIAKEKREEEATIVDAEYQKHHKAVDKMMNL